MGSYATDHHLKHPPAMERMLRLTSSQLSRRVKYRAAVVTSASGRLRAPSPTTRSTAPGEQATNGIGRRLADHRRLLLGEIPAAKVTPRRR